MYPSSLAGEVAVGLVVGILVGLTGLGGGMLLLPLLISVLGVPPILAVGSDAVIKLRHENRCGRPPLAPWQCELAARSKPCLRQHTRSHSRNSSPDAQCVPLMAKASTTS